MTNIPPKLQKDFENAGGYHSLAKKLDINVSYVYNFLKKGIEPYDTTPKGRRIRRAMHLSSYKPRPGRRKQPAADHMKWWRRLGKGRQSQLIQQLYEIGRANQLGPKRRSLLLEILYQYSQETRLWQAKKTKTKKERSR